MLEKLKILLDIVGITQDKLLIIYLEEAEDTVRTYCNFKETDSLNNALNSAILRLTVLNYRSRGYENITQMSQGSRSQTFKNVGGSFNNVLPSEIEVLCKPYRKVRLL